MFGVISPSAASGASRSGSTGASSSSPGSFAWAPRRPGAAEPGARPRAGVLLGRRLPGGSRLLRLAARARAGATPSLARREGHTVEGITLGLLGRPRGAHQRRCRGRRARRPASRASARWPASRWPLRFGLVAVALGSCCPWAKRLARPGCCRLGWPSSSTSCLAMFNACYPARPSMAAASPGAVAVALRAVTSSQATRWATRLGQLLGYGDGARSHGALGRRRHRGLWSSCWGRTIPARLGLESLGLDVSKGLQVGSAVRVADGVMTHDPAGPGARSRGHFVSAALLAPRAARPTWPSLAPSLRPRSDGLWVDRSRMHRRRAGRLRGGG